MHVNTFSLHIVRYTTYDVWLCGVIRSICRYYTIRYAVECTVYSVYYLIFTWCCRVQCTVYMPVKSYEVQCTPILHDIQCTLYTVHYTLQYTCIYGIHYIYGIYIHCMYIYCIYNTLYYIHCTEYIIQCTVYSVHCILYSVQCTLYNVQCIVYLFLPIHCQ